MSTSAPSHIGCVHYRYGMTYNILAKRVLLRIANFLLLAPVQVSRCPPYIEWFLCIAPVVPSPSHAALKIAAV